MVTGKWISRQILWDQSESDFILKNAERKNIDKQNSDKGKHSIQREFNAEKKYKLTLTWGRTQFFYTRY